MNPSTKRILSTVAIIVASVAFGVLITADLGLVKRSNAQSAPIQTAQGAVASVTIPSFADVAARVMPAVVSIESTEIVRRSQQRRPFGGGMDPFEFFFPDPRNPHRQAPESDDEQRQESGGSGFIISPDGFILTNNHVVENATRVRVRYGADENGNGGRRVTATIVGRDPATDIALLKIEANRQLPVLPLGDSERIRKGDWAIAVGHPFNLENTLTVGVISAKGRSLGLGSTEARSFENFIQTDAAINFGNSGGPLMNIAGEVVGINTAIRGGAQGLGFATPINTAKRLLPMLKQGKVTRSYLGMQITEVNDQMREAFDLSEARGALVQFVDPGKPADRAGIKAGDVIIEIDGRPIRNNRDLIDYISYLPVGTNVKVTMIRNGQRTTVTAKTAQRPNGDDEDEETEEAAAEPVRDKLGISISPMTAELRAMHRHAENVQGVVVTSVKNVSPAGEANIAAGDVITEVQGQKTNTVGEFRAAVEKLRSGQYARMYVITSPARTGQSVAGYRIVQVP